MRPRLGARFWRGVLFGTALSVVLWLLLAAALLLEVRAWG